jgi:hypothetical protein
VTEAQRRILTRRPCYLSDVKGKGDNLETRMLNVRVRLLVADLSVLFMSRGAKVRRVAALQIHLCV